MGTTWHDPPTTVLLLPNGFDTFNCKPAAVSEPAAASERYTLRSCCCCSFNLFIQGKQSRSLKAIYYLQQAGFTNVAHISGGFSQWVRDGLPVMGSDAGDDDGDDGDDGEQGRQAGESKGLSLVGSLLGGRQSGG
jgi:hypothetical protein